MTWLFEMLFPKFLWRIKTSDKKIFLTFDDGPIPEVTDWVLDQLDRYSAKATFFCVGENIERNPTVFKKIIKNGHAIGNHTYNHLKGWETENEVYLNNFNYCQKALENIGQISTNLFRPPYGRIKKTQAQEILKTHKIVMWSVLTKDYDANYDTDVCLRNAIKKTKPGSIVLFHDSIKAHKNLQFVLPRYLEFFHSQGFTFEILT